MQDLILAAGAMLEGGQVTSAPTVRTSRVIHGSILPRDSVHRVLSTSYSSNNSMALKKIRTLKPLACVLLV